MFHLRKHLNASGKTFIHLVQPQMKTWYFRQKLWDLNRTQGNKSSSAGSAVKKTTQNYKKNTETDLCEWICREQNCSTEVESWIKVELVLIFCSYYNIYLFIFLCLWHLLPCAQVGKVKIPTRKHVEKMYLLLLPSSPVVGAEQEHKRDCSSLTPEHIIEENQDKTCKSQ